MMRITTFPSLFSRLLLLPILSLSPHASGSESRGALALTEFTPGSPDLGWYVVNDTVMGGRSSGEFLSENGALQFTGRTNTQGGGFSSIRTKPMRLDVSEYAGIRLTVKGDGRRYSWRLVTEARWRGRQITYRADFDTRSGTWSTIDLPFSGFSPGFRGYALDGPALDAAQIRGMGLMIYDRQDGPFDIHLGNVAAYTVVPPFTVEQYRWQNRVLVISAPRGDDENLRAQQDAVALTPDEFANRDLVLVTLIDDQSSMAGDRTLTTVETAAARADLNIPPESFALRLIGKDGGVKFSATTAHSMAKIYALIDGMPMRQSEQADRHGD